MCDLVCLKYDGLFLLDRASQASEFCFYMFS